MPIPNIQALLDEIKRSSPDVQQQAQSMLSQYGGTPANSPMSGAGGYDDQNPAQFEPLGGVYADRLPPSTMPPISQILAQVTSGDPRNAELEHQGVAERYISPDAEQPDKLNIAEILANTIQNQGTPTGMPNGVNPNTQPVNQPMSLDDRLKAAQAENFEKVNAPPKKHKWWKNAGIIAAEIASNVFNPQNQVPIRSWGGLKKDAGVKDAAGKLQTLQQQKIFNTAQEKAAADIELDKERANELKNRPQERLNQIKARADAALERIKVNADVASGTKQAYINDKGQLAYRYLKPDRNGKYKDDELELGVDNQPVTIPGEQPMSFYNPQTNKWETVKAKQGVLPAATLADKNATLNMDIKRRNLERQARNDAKLKAWNDAISELSGGSLADVEQFNEYQKANKNAQAQIDAILATREIDSTTGQPKYDYSDQIKPYQDQINKNNTEIIKLKGDIVKRGSSKPEKPQLEEMETENVTLPSNSGTVGNTGKPVPKSKDPDGLYQ